MKFLVIIFSIFSFTVCSQSFKLKLDNIGKPMYQKELKADRALIVYKGEKKSFAQILPKEYYNLGNCNDTLNLEISNQSPIDSSDTYFVNCTNCENIKFRQENIDGTIYFIFSKGEDFVRFIVSFERIPKAMHSAPPLKGEIKDSLIGYIRLQNTFIHYSPIFPNSKVNIGVIDKNFNGRVDSTDFVALSDDNYFFTTPNEKSKVISGVKTIKVNGVVYSLKIDSLIYSISLERMESLSQTDLVYNDSLTNIKLGEKNLYDILENNEYLLISYWSEFCSPCIGGIPKLNSVPENVKVVGLYYGNTPLKEVEKRYSVKFYNTESQENAVAMFNLNGFPNYILIDKTRKVILNTRELDEVIKIIR